MTTRLALKGSVVATPYSPGSGVAAASVPLDEALVLAGFEPARRYTLTADSYQAINLGALTAVNYVGLKVISGGPVKLRVSTADDANQVVPVDSFLLLGSRRTNLTALSVLRAPATETVVEVQLGQAAT